jgi:hypothetical protein
MGILGKALIFQAEMIMEKFKKSLDLFLEILYNFRNEEFKKSLYNRKKIKKKKDN